MRIKRGSRCDLLELDRYVKGSELRSDSLAGDPGDRVGRVSEHEGDGLLADSIRLIRRVVRPACFGSLLVRLVQGGF